MGRGGQGGGGGVDDYSKKATISNISVKGAII